MTDQAEISEHGENWEVIGYLQPVIGADGILVTPILRDKRKPDKWFYEFSPNEDIRSKVESLPKKGKNGIPYLGCPGFKKLGKPLPYSYQSIYVWMPEEDRLIKTWVSFQTKKVMEKGGYKEEVGTNVDDMGKLLELYKIPVEQRWHCTLDDLKREIEQGNKVIVAVNAGLLWYDKDIGESGHTVWVTGLRIDPSSGRIVSVAMNDSGNEKIDGGGEVPIDRFMRAWEKSKGVMVATRLSKK